MSLHVLAETGFKFHNFSTLLTLGALVCVTLHVLAGTVFMFHNLPTLLRIRALDHVSAYVD